MTPAADMPRTGTATYRTIIAGDYYYQNFDRLDLSGDGGVTADFANGTVDMFINMLPERWRRLLQLVLDVAVICLMATFVYYGWIMAEVNKPQLSSALSISLFWIYLAIPVGSALIIVAMIAKIIRDFREARQGDA